MKIKLIIFNLICSLILCLGLTACADKPKIGGSSAATQVGAVIVEFPQIETVIAKSEFFLKWLNDNKSYFASCKPKKAGNKIELCDGTLIEIEQAKKLFRLGAADLIQFVKDNKINLEIHCQNKRKLNIFKNWCKPNVNNNFFKEVSALHGQYIAYNNTIALHSDANIGSLVHEYFHYLQFSNSNKVFARVYKKERIDVQTEILAVFDQLILGTQALEKNGKHEEAKRSLVHAVRLSALLQKFGYWQKLIDERNLFLTFIQFGPELGIADDDIELARRNMKFLCRSPEFQNLVSPDECKG